MKATVLQENLGKGLAMVSRSVASKPQVPVLANILFRGTKNGLELSATNLETGVRLIVAGKVDEGFEMTIPSRQLTEFVAGMPSGQVELELNEGKMKIKGSKFRAELSGISASEFPVIPVAAGDAEVTVGKKEWVESLEKVVFAAATDEGRPVLTGVLIEASEEGLVCVATDGYRMSKVEVKPQAASHKPQAQKLIIPARAVAELLRLCGESEAKEIKVWVTREANQVIFKVGDIELVSRLIEGNFPDYNKIIPQNSSTSVIADREELVRGVKLASVFARESANIIKFNVQDALINISANSPQLGSDEGEVEAKITGDNIEIAFNFRYVMDFLNNVDSSEVEFNSSGPLAPGVWKGVGKEMFLHVIMPVRIQS